ncbi:MAG: hypothetical protein M1828_001977 [Chrysothrix sp. TS-e1954]|nr:MAG: hypothetical protein M1828_001977 [Chrysothrix sp. TS-e1954]
MANSLHRTVTNPPLSKLHEITLVVILCSAQLLTQAALGQAIAPLHIIGSTFATNPSPGTLSWYPAAYSLTVGTFILPAGRLGDTYGHRRLFIVGYAWFALWSLIAGFSAFAHTSGGSIFFSVCRAMQGIGPAMMLPNAIAIIGRTYPGERKNMIFGLLGATAPGGFVLGATFSSLLAQREWWPWAYWILGLVAAGVTLLACFVVPVAQEEAQDEEEKEASKAGLVQRLDLLGATTGVVGLVLVNFAWNQGPNAGWTTVYVYVMLIIGLLFLAAFAFVEIRVRFPLVPIRDISGDALFVLGCIAAGWSSFGIWVFYYFQLSEVIEGASPLLTTARITPAAVSGLCASVVAGLIISRVVPGAVMLVSMTAFTIGSILLATRPVGQIYWAQLFVAAIVMPWGMDLSFPSATIVMSNTLPRNKQGLAASLVNTVLNYSISIGLGAAGLVESKLNRGGTDILRGYRSAWYLGIGLGCAGMAISVYFIVTGVTRKRRETHKAALVDMDSETSADREAESKAETAAGGVA